MKSITAKELDNWLKNSDSDKPLLLDVREDNEVALCSLPEAIHIPMNRIPIEQDKLPDGQDIVVYCHHGMRSQQVIHYLLEAGFDEEHLYSLVGGIDAWASDIDPKMPRY